MQLEKDCIRIAKWNPISIDKIREIFSYSSVWMFSYLGSYGKWKCWELSPVIALSLWMSWLWRQEYQHIRGTIASNRQNVGTHLPEDHGKHVTTTNHYRTYTRLLKQCDPPMRTTVDTSSCVQFLWHDYWRVRKIAKTDLQLRHVFARPRGTARPPLDVCSWNLIFAYFS